LEYTPIFFDYIRNVLLLLQFFTDNCLLFVPLFVSISGTKIHRIQKIRRQAAEELRFTRRNAEGGHGVVVTGDLPDCVTPRPRNLRFYTHPDHPPYLCSKSPTQHRAAAVFFLPQS